MSALSMSNIGTYDLHSTFWWSVGTFFIHNYVFYASDSPETAVLRQILILNDKIALILSDKMLEAFCRIQVNKTETTIFIAFRADKLLSPFSLSLAPLHVIGSTWFAQIFWWILYCNSVSSPRHDLDLIFNLKFFPCSVLKWSESHNVFFT